MNLQALKLPQEVREDLEVIGNHGLAKKTWSSYATATKMFEKCCNEKGLPNTWPVSDNTVLIFIHWLLIERKVGASTIEMYLAGLRKAQVAQGWPAPTIRSELINTIIRGKKNMQAAENRRTQTEGRRPVTKDILQLLKASIGKWDACTEDKRLVWAVATVSFHGAFRMGELLARTEAVFDPQYTLLARDIAVDTSYAIGGAKGVARFRIKSPKEDKANRSLIVDVFGTGGNICPVRAVQKWRQAVGEQVPDQPAFTWSTGQPLTARKFTGCVRQRLAKYMKGEEKRIAAHSFRIGLASMLGELGYSEEDIKAMGRWSSRAWLEYVKHPRTQRIEVARAMN